MSWISWAKDNHNSRIADSILIPPLTIKWDCAIPCGNSGSPHNIIHQGSRLLHKDGRVFVCFLRKTSPWISLHSGNSVGQIFNIYDDINGNLLAAWGNATGWGSIGMFVLYADWIYGGCDHSQGFRYNFKTGEYYQMGGMGGPSPIPGFTTIDESGIYGYGEDGINSSNCAVKAIGFDNQVKWINSRPAVQLGISSLITGGFCYTYFGHGSMVTEGNSLFVPDGVFRQYDKNTGADIWKIGVYPQSALSTSSYYKDISVATGKVCHFSGTLCSDGIIFTAGRECISKGNLDHPYPVAINPPSGYIATQWSVPRIYGYRISDHQKVYQIDLPEYNTDLLPLTDNTFMYDFSGFPFEFIISNGILYVSCKDRILAIKLTDQQIIWTYNKLPANDSFPYPYYLMYHNMQQFKDVAGDIVLSGNILYGSHRFGNYIFAIDISSGMEIWRFTSPEMVDYFTGLIVDDGKLFASTIKGHLYCFEGGIEVPPELPPSTDPIEEGGGDGKYIIVRHIMNKILTIADMQKLHVMDVSDKNREFTLPDSPGIGNWIKISKKGTNILTVNGIVCDELLDFIFSKDGEWIIK